MVERNAGVALEKRIEFRIGIHLGDVVEESDGDLMGDGVNIAARLEGVCEPGAVCLSEDAYRQVKGRLDLVVSDLGHTQLKNIAEPIRVYSLRVGVPTQTKPARSEANRARRQSVRRSFRSPQRLARSTGPGRRRGRVGPGSSVRTGLRRSLPRRRPRLRKISIVVLPFTNLSNSPAQGLFRRRRHRESHHRIVASPQQLRHRPQHRLHLQGQKRRCQKPSAREFGVRYVLEGLRTVQRDAWPTVRVNAQLIDGWDPARMSGRIDSKKNVVDLFKLQDEVVARRARALQDRAGERRRSPAQPARPTYEIPTPSI